MTGQPGDKGWKYGARGEQRKGLLDEGGVPEILGGHDGQAFILLRF